MNVNSSDVRFGEIAAIGTWSIVFGICLYWLPNVAEDIQSLSWLIVLLFLTYLGCFLALIRRKLPQDKKLIYYGVILLQLVCAFALMLILPVDFLPILTIIWVAILPHLTSLRNSVIITFGVLILWFVLEAIRWQDKNVLFSALLYSTFHFFAILMNYETVKAERASLEAARLNKELQATQNLLAQASRQNERTRIARDLHDLLGHHLTALIINLQVAGHLTDGEAKNKVEQCHSLAKLLLSDVREAVSMLRENQQLEFSKMLDLMCEQVPKLTIHRDISVELSLEEMEIAKAMLSCIQEALTNSLRHSEASEFWITLNRHEDSYQLELYDNGFITKDITPGNGLTGMIERVENLEGSLEYRKVQNSLLIEINIPLTLSKAEG